MKKTAAVLISLLLFVVALGVTFIAGRKSGFQEASGIADLKVQSLGALDALGSYAVHVDTATHMTKGSTAKALCSVEVYASAKVMQVRECLQAPTCKRLIESEVQKTAPELLNGGTPKIRFFAVGEACDAK